MKIYKIAQSGGAGGAGGAGGTGGTRLVLIIDKKTGALKTEIIGHDGPKTCANSSEEDQALLRDLMESEVDGISGLGEITDEGENSLAMRELLSKKPATPLKVPEKKPVEEQKKKQKKLDVGGYGV